ncbi:MAG: ectoine/hydroxyectoine ABC transporter permease subunit EhuC [Gammaproteobacteria bacterium]|nr:ectoine/hydroxyectoine ABC transporter permease subunit EhuC [Gammaproteobacteria bacterium]MBU0787995.1 ectoine/hydroxyectoine ABC transporter permease subunit EhuC [Gammaproteobacteria bacterium]MBU0815507.1 ectoine/hydroxyectoine ABC transporter permease subunit EhuC [Gammaproteobacteria bacterium]MBU1785385.1 ectoine/hydroxyectoine ABC transporter permease subunit EhuC [Gammaproteobacteria bacterium]
MGELLPLLLRGAYQTMQITLLAALLGVVMAMLAALAKTSPMRPLRWIANIYIEVFRGTSLLVQLFWLFFVLPLPPFNLSLTPLTVAVAGLGLHIGAYGAEIMRGALAAVPHGQIEAAIALNIPPLQRFMSIILPQALIKAIPPGTNLLIELLKATSLVSLITLSDLTFRSTQLVQATFRTAEIFSLTLLIYFVLAQAINLSMRLLEKRITHGMVQGDMS